MNSHLTDNFIKFAYDNPAANAEYNRVKSRQLADRQSFDADAARLKQHLAQPRLEAERRKNEQVAKVRAAAANKQLEQQQASEQAQAIRRNDYEKATKFNPLLKGKAIMNPRGAPYLPIPHPGSTMPIAEANRVSPYPINTVNPAGAPMPTALNPEYGNAVPVEKEFNEAKAQRISGLNYRLSKSHAGRHHPQSLESAGIIRQAPMGITDKLKYFFTHGGEWPEEFASGYKINDIDILEEQNLDQYQRDKRNELIRQNRAGSWSTVSPTLKHLMSSRSLDPNIQNATRYLPNSNMQ